MPVNRRAILADIHELGLDPHKAHTKLNIDGKLQGSKQDPEKFELIVEKIPKTISIPETFNQALNKLDHVASSQEDHHEDDEILHLDENSRSEPDVEIVNEINVETPIQQAEKQNKKGKRKSKDKNPLKEEEEN